jgi:choline dehydrogenase
VHAAAVEDYLSTQSGPLTGIGGGIFGIPFHNHIPLLTTHFLTTRPIGFEKLPNRTQLSFSTNQALSTYPPDFPELEYLGLSPGSNPPDAPLANNYVGITVLLEPTFSKGSVILRSANPHDAPIVDINALSHSAEIDLLVGGMKRVRELAQSTGVLVKEVSPGERVSSDEELEEWVRGHAGNGVHGACTSMCVRFLHVYMCTNSTCLPHVFRKYGGLHRANCVCEQMLWARSPTQTRLLIREGEYMELKG